jgi:hypothetical protein
MLGKLLKHEFKNTGKILLPLNLALIGVTLFGMIVVGLKVFNYEHTGMLAGALMVFYVLGIIALFIVTYVFLMINFYRSMYSSQGYLTHTLPVTPLMTLNTKLIVSVFWACLTALLTIGSILSIVMTGVKTYGASFNWSDFWAGFEKLTNLSAGSATAWSLLFIFLSCLSGLLMIYCSISIGQLFNKNKVLAAVITYVCIYIIMQIVSTIYMVATSANALTNAAVESSSTGAEMNLTGMNHGIVSGTFIISVVFAIIFYVVTAYISSKKVNLE